MQNKKNFTKGMTPEEIRNHTIKMRAFNLAIAKIKEQAKTKK